MYPCLFIVSFSFFLAQTLIKLRGWCGRGLWLHAERLSPVRRCKWTCNRNLWSLITCVCVALVQTWFRHCGITYIALMFGLFAHLRNMAVTLYLVARICSISKFALWFPVFPPVNRQKQYRNNRHIVLGKQYGVISIEMGKLAPRGTHRGKT